MVFKLTEEQVLEIIELYGGSKKKIDTIEARLNLIGVVKSEEDHYELVASIVSQSESVKEQMRNCSNASDRIERYMSLDEIISSELNRKYDNFENENLGTEMQLRKILNVK